MTIPTVVNIPDAVHGATFVDFVGLNSPGWIVAGYDARQELAELQPGDAKGMGLNDVQTIASFNGAYRKRRITEIFSFKGRFRKGSVDGWELRAISNPANGIITMTVENLVFTGYIDGQSMQYNFEGDYVDITISLYYQWKWYLVAAL